ncbi:MULTISPECIES: hypothetical protein [Micromonospora]|uniref:hypothetical protein n=1 Tax=Micromonospora TaxID=1873 RepID=UPI003557ECAA
MRVIIDGIRWRVRTRSPWRDIPRALPALAVRVPRTSSTLFTAVPLPTWAGGEPDWFRRPDLGEARCRVFREDDRLCCCDWPISV